MEYIVKNYELNLNEIEDIVILIYTRKYDKELKDLLSFAYHLSFFNTIEDHVYTDILKEFVKSKSTTDHQYKKIKALIDILIPSQRLKEMITKEIDLEYLKEVLKIKIRSYLVFSSVSSLSDIAFKFEEIDGQSQQQFFENLKQIEQILQNLQINLAYLTKSDIGITFDSKTDSDFSKISYFTREFQSPISQVIPYFETRRMYLIASLVKTGKSFFVLNLAERFWSMGYNVFLLSLENTMKEILSRFFTLVNYRHNILTENLEIRDFSRLNFQKDSKIKKIVNFIQSQPSRIKFIETPLLNINVLLQILEENRSSFDIFIVDWLDLIQGYQKDTMFEIYAKITRHLYNFAKEHDKILIGVSQLNREAFESDKPSVSQISRSWAKIEAVDAVLILNFLSNNKLVVEAPIARYFQQNMSYSYDVDFNHAFINF